MCIDQFEEFCLQGGAFSWLHSRQTLTITANLCRSTNPQECAGYNEQESEFDNSFFELKALTRQMDFTKFGERPTVTVLKELGLFQLTSSLTNFFKIPIRPNVIQAADDLF